MNENSNIEKQVALKEIQAHLGVGRETILQWITKHNMSAYKIGRFQRFKISEVDGWVHSGEAADKANSDKNKEA